MQQPMHSTPIAHFVRRDRCIRQEARVCCSAARLAARRRSSLFISLCLYSLLDAVLLLVHCSLMLRSLVLRARIEDVAALCPLEEPEPGNVNEAVRAEGDRWFDAEDAVGLCFIAT